MRTLLCLALTIGLALPGGAEVVASAPTLTVSSPTVTDARPPGPRVGLLPPGPQKRAAIGVGGGIGEGPALEVMVWGGTGAIIGSAAGPIGAAVGGAFGAVVGLIYSFFVVPRIQPGLEKAD